MMAEREALDFFHDLVTENQKLRQAICLMRSEVVLHACDIPNLLQRDLLLLKTREIMADAMKNWKAED